MFSRHIFYPQIFHNFKYIVHHRQQNVCTKTQNTEMIKFIDFLIREHEMRDCEALNELLFVSDLKLLDSILASNEANNEANKEMNEELDELDELASIFSSNLGDW